jgi:methylated-DNA-[protein]-cysteine S-methyltransferase
VKISDDGEGISEITICNPYNCNHFSNTALTDEAYLQISEYLSGNRKCFDIKLSLKGTEFQRAVWDQLSIIPYGKTKTYGEIASCLDNPKASRAVGMACNKNPIMILVPCHRIIGKNGSLTGYALGLDIKKYLLNMEKERDSK